MAVQSVRRRPGRGPTARFRRARAVRTRRGLLCASVRRRGARGGRLPRRWLFGPFAAGRAVLVEGSQGSAWASPSRSCNARAPVPDGEAHRETACLAGGCSGRSPQAEQARSGVPRFGLGEPQPFVQGEGVCASVPVGEAHREAACLAGGCSGRSPQAEQPRSGVPRLGVGEPSRSYNASASVRRCKTERRTGPPRPWLFRSFAAGRAALDAGPTVRPWRTPAARTTRRRPCASARRRDAPADHPPRPAPRV